MRNIKKLSLLILSSVAFIVPAYAESAYVVGQVGHSYADSEYNGLRLSQDKHHSSGITGRVAGGYEWNNLSTLGNTPENTNTFCLNYGIELGYQYYNNAPNNNFYHWNGHRHTIDLLGVLDIDVNPLIDVFVKLGPALTKTQYISDNTVVAKVIGGVGYNLTDNINLNLAYTHEFGREHVSSISSVLGGVKFSFC